jgi:hypothetical protein
VNAHPSLSRRPTKKSDRVFVEGSIETCHKRLLHLKRPNGAGSVKPLGKQGLEWRSTDGINALEVNLVDESNLLKK